MIKPNVLVIEDEELMRSILRQLLERSGYKVFTADSSESGMEIYSANDIAVILTDIKLPGMDGLTFLDHIKTIDQEAIVIVMTAYSSVDSAIAALRKGAYDYVTKPFVNDELLHSVKNAIKQRELFRENRALRRELGRQYNFDEMIGSSKELRSIFELVKKVAETTSNVLIQGESGTGKELVARALHFNSSRAGKPFLAVNCGAMPEHLLESEFFGHTKGSFTGAVADKKGIFRSVAGGTLFLDEIAEMPQSLQVKLLRALQQHEVTPIGSTESLRFDARVVAATNKDLEREAAEGKFREDLFYRLNVIEISIPSLRERRGDISLLAKHFIAKAARDQNLPEKNITSEAMAALLDHSWPGNVRELENAIERAFILSGDEIGVESLPPKLSRTAGTGDASTNQTLDEVERRYVLETLEATGDDKVEAARILGIDLSTLYRKLKRYDNN